VVDNSNPLISFSFAIESYCGSFLFLYESIVFELRASYLLSGCSIPQATPQSRFALVISHTGSHVYAWVGLDSDPPVLPPS
jgi:hypothetical protein